MIYIFIFKYNHGSCGGLFELADYAGLDTTKYTFFPQFERWIEIILSPQENKVQVRSV